MNMYKIYSNWLLVYLVFAILLLISIYSFSCNASILLGVISLLACIVVIYNPFLKHWKFKQDIAKELTDYYYVYVVSSSGNNEKDTYECIKYDTVKRKKLSLRYYRIAFIEECIERLRPYAERNNFSIDCTSARKAEICLSEIKCKNDLKREYCITCDLNNDADGEGLESDKEIIRSVNSCLQSIITFIKESNDSKRV